MRKLTFILLMGWVFFPSIVMAAEVTPVSELLENAKAGDTIQLENHVYEEDIIIDKSVHIKGAENTVIRGTGNGDVITIKADGITLENVTIQHSSSNLDEDFAAIKVLSHHNKILHNTIEDSLHGIYLERSNGNALIGNKIDGNLDLNISRRGNGIHLFHSSDNLLKNNTIDGARDGIYFSFADQTEITGNTISNTRYGIHYMYSHYNEFYDNEAFQNTGGAAIMYSTNITLRDNTFYDHHGLQSFGILLQTADEVVAENNEIYFNTKGIFMDQSGDNVIRNNLIANNQFGFDIWNSSTNNVITGNDIFDNSLHYTTNDHAMDKNIWSEDGAGNAWSGYTFIDLDQDGIGDKPYTYHSAFGEVLTEHQLGILFLNSPALDLYESWNKMVTPTEGVIQDSNPIHSSHTQSIPVLLILQMMAIFGVVIWMAFSFRRAN